MTENGGLLRMTENGGLLRMTERPLCSSRDRGRDNLDALPEVHKVRGCIEADAEAAGSKGRRQHRTDGALTVGPRHMHGTELPLRMAQEPGVRQHRIEPRLVRVATEACIPHAPVPLIQRLNNGRIIHQSQFTKWSVSLR